MDHPRLLHNQHDILQPMLTKIKDEFPIGLLTPEIYKAQFENSRHQYKFRNQTLPEQTAEYRTKKRMQRERLKKAEQNHLNLYHLAARATKYHD